MLPLKLWPNILNAQQYETKHVYSSAFVTLQTAMKTSQRAYGMA